MSVASRFMFVVGVEVGVVVAVGGGGDGVEADGTAEVFTLFVCLATSLFNLTALLLMFRTAS